MTSQASLYHVFVSTHLATYPEVRLLTVGQGHLGIGRLWGEREEGSGTEHGTPHGRKDFGTGEADL